MGSFFVCNFIFNHSDLRGMFLQSINGDRKESAKFSGFFFHIISHTFFIFLRYLFVKVEE